MSSFHYYKLGQMRACACFGFSKEAISRLDAELQQGTITPADVVPGASQRAAHPGATGAPARRGMRRALLAPSTALNVGRLREMRARLAEAQRKRPDVTLGLTAGKNVRVVRNPADMRTPVATLGGPIEAIGPSMWLRNTRQRGEIYLPDEEEFELKKIQNNRKLREASKLPTLQHELGEFEQYLGKDLMPFGTHAGTNPNVREKFHLTGDPVMYKEFAKSRTNSPDDVLFEKLYRQVGGTPDNPIPLHGKQHAALNKQMLRRAGEFSPEAKLLGLHHASGKLLSDKGKYKVPYVTSEALNDYEAAVPNIRRYVQTQTRMLPAAAKSRKISETIHKRLVGHEQAVRDAVSRRLLRFLGLRSPKTILDAYRVAR